MKSDGHEKVQVKDWMAAVTVQSKVHQQFWPRGKRITSPPSR